MSYDKNLDNFVESPLGYRNIGSALLQSIYCYYYQPTFYVRLVIIGDNSKCSFKPVTDFF